MRRAGYPGGKINNPYYSRQSLLEMYTAVVVYFGTVESCAAYIGVRRRSRPLGKVEGVALRQRADKLVQTTVRCIVALAVFVLRGIPLHHRYVLIPHRVVVVVVIFTINSALLLPCTLTSSCPGFGGDFRKHTIRNTSLSNVTTEEQTSEQTRTRKEAARARCFDPEVDAETKQ